MRHNQITLQRKNQSQEQGMLSIAYYPDFEGGKWEPQDQNT